MFDTLSCVVFPLFHKKALRINLSGVVLLGFLGPILCPLYHITFVPSYKISYDDNDDNPRVSPGVGENKYLLKA